MISPTWTLAPGSYNFYRGENVWLRITGNVTGGGTISPIFQQSGYDSPTELWVYADDVPAWHAPNYRSLSSFVTNITADKSVKIYTQEPIADAVVAPTSPAAPATTQKSILPLAAIAGLALLLIGLTRRKRRG